MVTLQARCKSRHYVAAIMPLIGTADRSEYQVTVFLRGHEVFQQTKRSFGEAMETAHTYLDRQTEQDFDS